MDVFGTAGIRGDVRDRVTPSLALSVGHAVGVDAETVVIGRDGRVTGQSLAAAVAAGVTSAGARALRAGMLPTPALANASEGRHGIMLTASHNPPSDNGLKLFVDGEEYDSAREAMIEDRLASTHEPTSWDRFGSVERISPLDSYRAAVVEYATSIATPGELSALTVVVDCANGMAALGTPQVLRSLGAHVITLNGNVDGHFPGRPSKPTPVTLSDCRAMVASTEGLVIGIGHDGDADRIVVIDGEGEIIHEDTILAVLAEHYVRRSDADEPVVLTTPNASDRIDERVSVAGGRTERTRLGYLHDGIDRLRNADETVAFAGEPWKHVHPAFGPWIDGVVSAAVLTALIASESDGLDGIREQITERPYRKVNVDCPDALKGSVMDRLETTMPDAFPSATISTDYGVRVSLPDGSWTLVRPSGTEPYVRVYAESPTVDELVSTVRNVVTETVENVDA